ncbi:MAG: sigma-70 family RNA polymerase sigma factor [Thermoguttaceae bacterium]|nr:sigma-70 family RNA polymerase sigma factor [Thermoguttaceae bacterium]MDW8038727.1 sigma-70 family RNA polymerase sigma factor [Thermoguttaceae bacterium]
MSVRYRNPVLRELRDQLVRFAPRDKKIQQANAAEQLLAELDPQRPYPYAYLCFRITNYKPQEHGRLLISGQEAIHDLRLLIEDLTDAAEIPATEASERVWTLEELCNYFQVSSKTISRWRELGLVARRFIFDGRKRIGFLQSSVDRFLEAHAERVCRRNRFSKLTEAERDWIIRRARRMAAAGGCPHEVARRLAARLGRSVETIRQALRQFDQQYPHLAIFPDHTGPIRPETRRKIYQEYRQGVSVAELAAKYCRSRTSIYRIISEVRAEQILQLPLEYIPNEQFAQIAADPAWEAEVLGPAPPSQEPPKKPKLPAGLPPYLASLYEVPLLTPEQELHLFRKLNYLKYKASLLRQQLDPQAPRTALMDQIESLYSQIVETKNEIIRANLRLVVSIAKRHVGPNTNFFELVSDGNMSLIRAVEKFDFAKGYKFSTYASWAIMKNFARTIPESSRLRERYKTVPQELFADTEDLRPNPQEIESAQDRRKIQVERMLEYLDPREQQIILRRFGLLQGQEPLTLKQVGKQLGVTKERIRQLEARALQKLRKVVEEKIEFTEIAD